MKFQYEIELVFIRLIIKRNLISDSILRISLLELQDSLKANSRIRQAEELTLRKNHKIIQLEGMNSFKFVLKEEERGPVRLTIKYEIKGTGDERVRSIPIDSEKIIAAFEKQNKSIIDQNFGGENAELLFRFYIKKNQSQEQNNVAAVAPEEQQNVISTRRSNSISRTKRPPNLNIGKKNKLSQHEHKSAASPNSTLGYKLQKQKIMQDIQKDSSIQDSPMPVRHKIPAIATSEIEKVNILITTHHRPKESYAAHLSYKLKIVIFMIIIGICFLAYDTIRDKTIRRKPKGHERLHGSQGRVGSKAKKNH